MTEVRRAPARLSRWGSVSVALLALAASGFYSWLGLVAGTAGLAVLVVGLVRGEHGAVTGGAFGLFLGAITAGVQGAPVLAVLLSVTCSVVAWDSGGNAISIGEQLGRDADTRRIEAVHMTASGGVGVVTAGTGYGLYLAGTGGHPVAALVFLLVAAVLLVEALG